MANTGRLVKELMVRELTAELRQGPNFFIARVGPLQATEADALRKQLKGVQAKLLVVKRTLSLRGISGLKLNGTSELFAGTVALVLPADDIIQAAKLIVEFAKANQGKLTIRGGWVDGQLLDHRRVEELASLPPRPQLIAQLIGMIESPIADLAWVLEGLLREVAWVLEEAAKNKDESIVRGPSSTS